MNAREFRLPRPDERLTNIGRTGSGKTTLGLWVLSEADLDKRPHIIVDYKGDRLIEKLERSANAAHEVGLRERVKHPGLYIVRPIAERDDQAVNDLLARVLDQERVGLFFDEGYMIPDKWPLRAVYTQGRSKHVSAITNSQRPSRMTLMAFTEASHISTFNLSYEQDQKRVAEYVPGYKGEQLPSFHSKWYDVDANQSHLLLPVPNESTILQRFRDRLGTRRRII